MKNKKISFNTKGFTQLTGNNEINKLINIFLAVSMLFVVFYLITLLVTSNEKEAIVPVDIQYSEILVSRILSQKQAIYYVLATKEEDINKELYDYYLNGYVTAKKVNVFEVNLDNIFNKSFVKEESNLEVSNIGDISFKDATLLRIEKGKITKALEGKDAIRTYILEKVK